MKKELLEKFLRKLFKRAFDRENFEGYKEGWDLGYIAGYEVGFNHVTSQISNGTNLDNLVQNHNWPDGELDKIR